MMNNNFNYYQQPIGGSQFGTQPVALKQPNFTQPLSAEDFAAFRAANNTDKFSIELTETDERMSRCAHRLENNESALKMVGDNMACCSVCGQQFSLERVTEANLASAIDTVETVLNQIKVYGLTLDKGIFTDFMTIIPLLKKVPKLYALANKNFAEIASGLRPIQPQMSFRGSDFDRMNNLLNGSYSTNRYGATAPAMTGAGMFVPGLGGFNQMIQQPMAMQQPMMQQPMAMQQPMMQQPMMQQPMQQPMMQPPVAPPQPAAAQQPTTMAQPAPQPAAAPQVQPFAEPYNQPLNK